VRRRGEGHCCSRLRLSRKSAATPFHCGAFQRPLRRGESHHRVEPTRRRLDALGRPVIGLFSNSRDLCDSLGPERASGVREPGRPLPRDERAWEASMERLEVALRREAVRRRLAGESPEVIAGELGRTCRRGAEPRLDRAPPDRRHQALGRRGAARSVRRGPPTARRRARTAAVRGQLLTLTRRMETEHQSSRSADRGRCCR
jgi:hypothetical protein